MKGGLVRKGDLEERKEDLETRLGLRASVFFKGFPDQMPKIFHSLKLTTEDSSSEINCFCSAQAQSQI